MYCKSLLFLLSLFVIASLAWLGKAIPSQLVYLIVSNGIASYRNDEKQNPLFSTQTKVTI